MTNSEKLFAHLATCRLKGAMPDWIVDPTNFKVVFNVNLGRRDVVEVAVGMRDGKFAMSVDGKWDAEVSLSDLRMYDKPFDAGEEGRALVAADNGLLTWNNPI